jgi:hypothetical protein
LKGEWLCNKRLGEINFSQFVIKLSTQPATSTCLWRSTCMPPSFFSTASQTTTDGHTDLLNFGHRKPEPKQTQLFSEAKQSNSTKQSKSMSLFRNLIQLSTSKSKPLLQNPNFLFTSLSHFTTDTPTRYAGLEPTKGDEKPRVVVLGSGWAGCRLMKGIDTDLYDVVCVSPRNHMVFTPLLASTCVGTLEFRSVAEPIGRIQPAISKAPGSYFFLANCTSLDTKKHMVMWCDLHFLCLLK